MTNTTKQISIDHLAPGMYVVGLDQSWLRTPFFSHRRLLKDQEDVETLKRCGVRWVTIDVERGRDVAGSAAAATAAAENAVEAVILDVMSSDEPASSSRAASDPVSEQPPASEAGPASPVGGSFSEELVRAAEVRGEAITAVQRLFAGVATGVPIDQPALRKVVTSILDRVLGNHGAMITQVLLQHLRRAGEDLFVHAVDTSILCLVVGKEHGLNFTQLEDLGTGALLHDVGQMRLPQNLLQKRGVYTEDEHKLMHMHPQLGTAMLTSSDELPDSVRRIAAEHHERVDGSGYPGGLKGSAISLLSQIVALVDRFDAMAGGRDGATRLPPGQAVRHLYQAGIKGQFDTVLVERLVQCLGVYPVGSLVELSTGERGIVVAVNSEQRTKPSVKLISDARGTPYDKPWVINLSDAGTSELRRAIRRILDASQEQVDVAAHFQR